MFQAHTPSTGRRVYGTVPQRPRVWAVGLPEAPYLYRQVDKASPVYREVDTVSLQLFSRRSIREALAPQLVGLYPLYLTRLRSVQSFEACAMSCATLADISAALPPHERDGFMEAALLKGLRSMPSRYGPWGQGRWKQGLRVLVGEGRRGEGEGEGRGGEGRRGEARRGEARRGDGPRAISGRQRSVTLHPSHRGPRLTGSPQRRGQPCVPASGARTSAS